MVEQHFATLVDRRFLVPSESAQHPTLHDLMVGPPRFTFTGRRQVASGLINAGAWLREFHGLGDGSDPPPTVRATAADVLAALREKAEFVAEHGGGDEVARVADAASAAIAAGAVRDPVSVGLAHGDFAPRNVRLGPKGAVAGFGMAAEPWRAPVYEDIAHFLMELPGRGTRRITSPRARRFLYGYFGDAPIPGRALATFGLLVRLDEWARSLSESREPHARSLRREMRALCAALEPEP